MKKNKKAEMYARITKHGENLKAIFNLPKETDPVKLCKALFSLEIKVNKVMCNLCNTNNIEGIEAHYETTAKGREWINLETSEEEQDKVFEGFKTKLEKIIGKHDFLFFNHDPRGYSLKIKDAYVREWREKTGGNIETDWGGYGIIAPDLTNS